jgi:hypothetical protein
MFKSSDERLEKKALVDEIRKLSKRIGELKGKEESLVEIDALQENIKALKSQVSDLEIQKSEKTEAFEKRERELTHKIGLERKRQQQESKHNKDELELAKREAKIEAEEKALEGKQAAFEERMQVVQESFKRELKSQEYLLSEILDRLPTVKVDKRIREQTTEKKNS